MKSLAGPGSRKGPAAVRVSSTISHSAWLSAHWSALRKASSMFGSQPQASGGGTRAAPWTVEPARPSDILFLVSNVSRFSGAGNFSDELYDLRGQKKMVAAAAKAILNRYGAFRSINSTAAFVVVRSEGRTIGAALTSTEDVKGPEVTIDFLVVDEAFHGQGIGKALARHVIGTADREACIQCWCAPKSHAMQCMLRSLRFRRTRREFCMPRGAGTIVIPSCWLLDLKKLKPNSQIG